MQRILLGHGMARFTWCGKQKNYRMPRNICILDEQCKTVYYNFIFQCALVYILKHSCFVCVCIQLFATPQSVACQPPLSIEFSRQEYWNGLPFSPPGDLPDPGIEPVSPVSSALAGGSFTTKPLVYLTLKFNWAFYILSVNPRHGSCMTRKQKGQEEAQKLHDTPGQQVDRKTRHFILVHQLHQTEKKLHKKLLLCWKVLNLNCHLLF